jgi:hypothetical protein
MTLVIAERTDKEVSFSADTRISFGNQGHFDKAIKVFSVPFKMKGPAKTREDFDKFEFEYNYGMAVIGSAVNAYTVKDSIAEVLPNITYLTNLSDFSIPSIGKLVFDSYVEISKEIASSLRGAGLCEILLGGFCLKEGRVRVLRFYPKVGKEKTEYYLDEILLTNKMLFFGSGKELAKQIYEKDKTLNPFQIIKKVINTESEKTVGGNIQSGTFYGKDFVINGILEKIVDKEGNTIETNKYRRGFKIQDEIKSATKPPYLFIRYGYKPFEFVQDDSEE